MKKIDTYVTIIFISAISISFIFAFVYVGFYNHSIKASADRFCIDHGFGKSTDMKVSGLNNYVQIECDNKFIFGDLGFVSVCDEYDKWGDCQKGNMEIG